MATASQQQQARRSSQETDRRHLLAPSQNTTPAPSAANSIIDFDTASTLRSGNTTPRAASPAPSQASQQQQPPKTYRGFPSEAAYLEALQQWAEGKKYLEPEVGLRGFYGNVTMEEYAGRPKLELGVRKKVKGWRMRREKKEEGNGR